MSMSVFGTNDGKISLNGRIYDPGVQQILIEGDSQVFIQENPPLTFGLGDIWINPATLKRSEPTIANGRAIWAEPQVLDKKGITDTTFNSILTPIITGLNTALSKMHSVLGGSSNGSGSDTTPPAINSISSVDTNSDSANVYSTGDRITINFNEPTQITLLTINDIVLNNGHNFGSGATLAPVNVVNGYASTFDITLGTGATVTGGDTITIAIGKVRDSVGNSNTYPITFLLPVLGGTIIAGGNGVGVPTINNISSTDIGGDSSGHYSAGDRIVVNFSEPIDSTLLTISNISISNGHTLGTGASVQPVNPANGYATTFYITLGTGTTVEPNDVISFNIASIRDIDGNSNTSVIEYVLPTLGGTNTGPDGSTDIVNVNIPEEFKPIEIKALPCNTPLPNGYLETTGVAISRNVFSGMFSKIGTTFGAGDGVTTFNLPNIPRTVDYKFTIGIRQEVTLPVAGTTLYLVDDAIIPDGWLATDGRCLVKEAYPELYAITGDMYGLCPSDSSIFKLANYASGSTGNKFAVKVSNNVIVPTTGSILMQLANEVVANGNLEIDGATVDRTTYNNIFKTIGVRYGAGDNATTFKLPTGAREAGYKYVMTTTDTTADIGDIFWMDSSVTPAGYIRCNGQFISKSAANSLFVRLGIRFGESTDGLKFKMPTIKQPASNNDVQFIETNVTPFIGANVIDVKVVDIDNARFLVKYHQLDGAVYKPHVYIGKIQVDNSVTYVPSSLVSSNALPIDAEFLLLNDGRVLVMGGKNSETGVKNTKLIVLSINSSDVVTSAELQDVTTSTAYVQDSFYTKFGISTLSDGRILCLGGYLEDYVGVNHSMIFTISTNNVTGVASTAYPTAITSDTKLRRLADGRLLALGIGIVDETIWRSEYRFLSIVGDAITYSANGILPTAIFGSDEVSSLEYAQTPDGNILVVGGYYNNVNQNNVCIGTITGDTITFVESAFNTPFAGINYHLLNIQNNNVILAGGQIVDTNSTLVSNNKVFVSGSAIDANMSDFVIRLGAGTPGLLNKTIL